MVSKDKTIEQLLMLHQSLVRIAYNAGADLEELARVATLKDTILKEYEDSK